MTGKKISYEGTVSDVVPVKGQRGMKGALLTRSDGIGTMIDPLSSTHKDGITFSSIEKK